MVDDKPEQTGPSDPPRRTPPTLDLEAIEISDETGKLEADAGEKPAAPRASSRGAALFSALVAAVVGTTAALLVIWWAGWPGKAPPPPAKVDNAAIDALAARVAKIESRPPAPPADTAAIDALAARVAGIESKAAAPPVAAPAAPAMDPALADRVHAVEKSVAALRDDVASAATRSQQLADSRDALEKSVAALRNDVASAAARSQQVADALDALKSTPREPPPPPDLSAINERLAKLEAATGTLSAQFAQREAKPADDPELRRAMAASMLDVSVRAGEPYAAPLAAAKPFAANPDALKPLDTFAATGVPSTNALNRELLALLPKLSPAAETTGSGIVDRLQAGASRLVRIERTEAVAGNDRSAIVARVTAAALRNDIVEARRELKTLAPADRAAAQAWIDKADARDAALAASRQFATEAMAALTKPAQ